MAVFLFILAVLAVYFAPSIVAAWRQHPRLIPIVVVNLLAGVTVVGWIGALYWSLTRSASALRKYEYYSERYGGMQVSSSEHISNSFLAGLGALVTVAAAAAIGLQMVENSHEQAASLQGLNGSPVLAATDAQKAPIPYRPATNSGAVHDVIKTAFHVAVPEARADNAQVPVTAPVVQSAAGTSVQFHPRHVANHANEKWYVDGVPLHERVAPQTVQKP